MEPRQREQGGRQPNTDNCAAPEKEDARAREIHVPENGVVVEQTRAHRLLRPVAMGRKGSRAVGENVLLERRLLGRVARHVAPCQARGFVQRLPPRVKAVRAGVQREHVRHGIARVEDAVVYLPPLVDAALQSTLVRVPISLSRTRAPRGVRWDCHPLLCNAK